MHYHFHSFPSPGNFLEKKKTKTKNKYLSSMRHSLRKCFVSNLNSLNLLFSRVITRKVNRDYKSLEYKHINSSSEKVSGLNSHFMYLKANV